MADDEIQMEQEIFSLVFDPSIDFKNIPPSLNSNSSSEICYLDTIKKYSDLKFPNKYIFNNTSKASYINCTFTEGYQSWQQINPISCTDILPPKAKGFPNGITNSAVAEVHRFKLPSHCLSRPHHTNFVSCPTNLILPQYLIRNLTTTKTPNKITEEKLFGKCFNSSESFDFMLSQAGDMEDYNHCQQSIQPTIHTFPHRQSEFSQNKMDSCSSYSNQDMVKLNDTQRGSKPHLIVIPHEDQSGHQQELIQEVYRYPPGSIETIVDKNPTLFANGNSNSNHSCKIERIKRKVQNQKKKKLHASQSSIASSSSALSSKSLSSLPSHTDSPLSRGSSSSSLNVNGSEISKTDHSLNASRSPFVHRKVRERCESEMSDSSSNVSTMSDLSGYEDEYMTVRRLISDGLNFAPGKKSLNLNASLRKKSYMETKTQEQENTIKSLHSCKEDLEIQVHRLSIQLQNAVREKEVCQEQLDIIQTKLTEKSQQEYFELLKEKVNLEGQYEALKQDFQHCSMNNAQLEAKLYQSKSDTEDSQKECAKLNETEKELKDMITNLKEQNYKMESELKAFNETLTIETNNLLTLKTELGERESSLTDMQTKIDAYVQESQNYQETIHNLKKWNLEYAEREEQQRLQHKKIENLLAESVGKVNALKENSQWYQLQLSKVQKLQSELQNELTKTKNTLSVVSVDRDRLKREVEGLNAEIEDNRAKAVRDKSLLLVQLEELEADMREREAMIRRLEKGDKDAHVKLSEDRFRRFEEDHKRLQELKIEMRESLRHNDTLKEELKHKSSVLRKHEVAIHDLRKDFAVMQEKLGSKRVCIDSLTERLNETKSKLEKAFEKVKENEMMITQLKEQKLKLEASVSVAEEDKKQVDETVVRLREDMSKLSSNFFRMKHDLSAKDKHIEMLSVQNSQLTLSEKELLSKTGKLSAQVKEHEGKMHLNEITLLKESVRKSNDENAKVNEELSRLKKSLESFQVEKKSLLNSLNLRDEQIENMQGVIDAYKEKILQKDEEIYTRKDHLSKLENNHGDLQKRFGFLNNEYQMGLQEKDEFHELEINYKNSIAELKENVKLEKRSKESCEKKYKDTLLELTSAKQQLKENVKVCENFNFIKTELEKEREKLKLREEEIRKIKAELEIRSNKLLYEENHVKCLNTKLEETRSTFEASENSYKECISIKDSELVKLQEVLSSKHSEIEKLHLIVAENEVKQKRSELNKKFFNSVRNHTFSDLVGAKQNTKKASKNYNKLSKDEKREVENLRQNLKEALNQVSTKDEEISALNAVVSKFEAFKTLNNSLNSEAEQMKKENVSLKTENETLNNRSISLQKDLHKSHSDFILKVAECNEWKMKYENLIDTIPQRDTNKHQTLNSDQWQVLPSYKVPLSAPFHSQEKLDTVDLEESMSQDFNLEERVKFTQTMTSLQKQISLTAEALQSKDRQIIELNKMLSTHTPSTHANQFQSSSCFNQQNSVLDNSKDIATKSFQSSQVGTDPVSFSDASTSTAELENHARELVEEKATQLSEVQKTLSTKELEFKEKQRRYESNTRLLTRKLKEHMKGRRAAEKELELVMQENKKTLEAEEKRYQVLKDRYIDMQKKSQHLEAEVVSCERIKRERELALQNIEKELGNERKTVLQMQKDIGQIEGLKHSLDNLRSKVNSLNAELMNKNKALKEEGETRQVALKEKQVLEDKCKSMASQIDELTQRLADEHLEVIERIKTLTTKQEEVNMKDEDIFNLKENMATVQLKCDNFKELIERIQRENSTKCKTIVLNEEKIEGLQRSIDLKNSSIEDLNAKEIILERELQIKGEAIESLKLESETLNKCLTESKEKNDASLALLNKKILESKDIETSLNEKLNVAHKDKMSYQSQCTQLKIALNSALGKLQASSTMPSFPSPSPLNTESLTKLMEQCSKPPPTTSRIMNSLTERLNSLREEVSVLQSEIKARDQSLQA